MLLYLMLSERILESVVGVSGVLTLSASPFVSSVSDQR